MRTLPFIELTVANESFRYDTDRVARVTNETPVDYKIRVNEATYFLYDHLGNTRVAFRAKDEDSVIVVNAMDYYSYGKILREYDNGAGDRYLTTNHERDRETGLDYRGARYYDSDVARFLSLDPMAAKYPNLSAYNYVAGNPVIFIDPTGKVFELPLNFVKQTVTAFSNYFYGLGGDTRITFESKAGNLQFTATPGTKEFDKMNNIANDVMTKYLPGGTKYDKATDEQKQQALFLRDMLSPAVIDIKYVGEKGQTKDARVADYYAHSINNGAIKSGGFYKGLKTYMSKTVNKKVVNTSEGYFEGTGIGGNTNSKEFAGKRKEGIESLMKLTNANTAISAVIGSVNGGTDPTNGTRAWIGGSDAKAYIDNASKVYNRAVFQFSFESAKGYHSFYRR